MLVQQERYDMAVQELRQVLTHEPEDARAHPASVARQSLNSVASA